MGCDYTIWIEYVIEYKDADEKVQKKVIRSPFHANMPCYVFGNEEDPHTEMKSHIASYGVNVYYENGKWTSNYFKNNKRKYWIGKLCELNNIPFQSLVYVAKRKDGEERF